MRNTAFFVAGVVLLVLQSNLFRLIELGLRLLHIVQVPGLVPSLVIPLIIFMGVHEYALVRGAGVAFALGYLTDLIGIAPIGLYTSTYVALYVLARAAGVRLAAQTVWMQMVLALGFTAIHSIMILVLLAIFGRDAYVPRTIYPMAIPHILATAAIAPLLFKLARRIHEGTMSGAPKEAR